MIRILFLIVVVFAVAAGFVWLADNPGEIAVTVAGYEVRTTLMALAIAVLVLILALVFSSSVLHPCFSRASYRILGNI